MRPLDFLFLGSAAFLGGSLLGSRNAYAQPHVNSVGTRCQISRSIRNIVNPTPMKILQDANEVLMAAYNPRGEILKLKTKSGTVNVLLEDENWVHSKETVGRNCYAFSLGMNRHIPGGAGGPVSLPTQVNDENLKKALDMDGGIFLGFDPSEATPDRNSKFDPRKTYYLVAAMMGREEYHFVRLFNKAWFSKPSKVTDAYQLTSQNTIPIGKGAFLNRLCKNKDPSQPKKYKPDYNPIGYYLFPVTGK